VEGGGGGGKWTHTSHLSNKIQNSITM